MSPRRYAKARSKEVVSRLLCNEPEKRMLSLCTRCEKLTLSTKGEDLSLIEVASRGQGADLCVLDFGRNGHIGSNEPGAHFASRTRVVRLAESTRRVNAADFEEGQVPERAITVGMATVFQAQEVLLLASGSNKARAVAAAVEGEISESVPASMLRRHPNTTFLLDREAATSLGDE